MLENAIGRTCVLTTFTTPIILPVDGILMAYCHYYPILCITWVAKGLQPKCEISAKDDTTARESAMLSKMKYNNHQLSPSMYLCKCCNISSYHFSSFPTKEVFSIILECTHACIHENNKTSFPSPRLVLFCHAFEFIVMVQLRVVYSLP